MVKNILALAALLTALATIGGALSYFGVAPALSGDIKKLNRKQADVAVEVYQNKVRSYMAWPPPQSQIQRDFIKEELDRARRQLDHAEKQKIELAD